MIQRRGSRPDEPKRGSGEMTESEDSVGRLMVTSVGLRFPESLDFAEWAGAGRKLAAIASSSRWCLGDWLVYGEHRYAGRYRVVADAVGLEYQTLRNYAWVCRCFDVARRRDDLSFQHHAEVASAPPAEQDRWLELAARYGWSRNDLRTRIRGRRAQLVNGASEEPSSPSFRLQGKRAEVWSAAADRVGSSLQEWVIAVLDDAAQQALSS